MRSIGVGGLLFFVAAVAAVISGGFVDKFVGMLGFEEGVVDIIVSCIEALVAAIAAGFVVIQLRSAEKESEHQTDVEKAEYIMEYNKAFVENEKMTEIERFLECRLTGVEPGTVRDVAEHRQDVVNYLVYLEGFSSCVPHVLGFEDIDDLFGYRFFLAMNHVEVQSMELLVFAQYYRGCFRLYDRWMDYRIASGKYSADDDWEIPLFETALCNQDGYEKYAVPDMVVDQVATNDPNILKFVASVPKTRSALKKQGWYSMTLCLKNGKDVSLSCDPEVVNNEAVYLKLLRCLLKELLYRHRITAISTKIETVEKIFDALLETRKTLYSDGLQFRQLRGSNKIPKKDLEEIARLIFYTDEYIGKDMFGNEEVAVAVLPELLKKNEDKMFRKDNIFLCEAGGKVLGIILWNKGDLQWDRAPLMEEIAALKAHAGVYKDKKYAKTAVPEDIDVTLRNVAKEYVCARYAGSGMTPSIDLLNVCVDERYRRMGICKKMLERFLSQNSGDVFELCVLSCNAGAIKRYTSAGFERIGTEQAYPKSMGPAHLRDMMRRKKEEGMDKDPVQEESCCRFRCCRAGACCAR